MKEPNSYTNIDRWEELDTPDDENWQEYEEYLDGKLGGRWYNE